MSSGYNLIPTPNRLECPMCGSSQFIIGQTIGSSDWLDYTKHYNEDMGRWKSDRKPGYHHCLYCFCTECLICGDESFFDPSKNPPRLYHDKKGFYIKQMLPPGMVDALYSKVELKCYIRNDNPAGLHFIGMLKVAQVKSIAGLPKFLTCGVNEIEKYAKVKLTQLKKIEKNLEMK